MFKFRISFFIHLGISNEIIPTSKGHIGNSTYTLKKSRQNLQDSYIHKKYHTFHTQAWSDHVMFNTKMMQTRPTWPTNVNAYPPKFQNNTNSITINNSALRSHVLPIMTFEFHCKTCKYTSGEACNDNPKNTLLWSSINSSKELVVCVVCPGCEVPLVQCCFCRFNINASHPDDIERLGKRRTPKGHCKKHASAHPPHIKQGRKRALSLDESAFPTKRSSFLDESSLATFSFAGDVSEEDNFDFDDMDFGCQNFFVDNLKDLSSESHISDGDNGIHSDSHCSFVLYDQCSDSSDSDDDEFIYGKDIVNAARQSACDDKNKETEEADRFIFQFTSLKLCPEGRINFRAPRTQSNGLQYKDFDIFELRQDHAKYFHGGIHVKLNQNQIYFFQRHQHKLRYPGQNFGGFLGLVGRSNIMDREDMSELADIEESRLIFELFHLLMNMTDGLKTHLMRYNMLLLKHCNVHEHVSTLRSPIPTDEQGMRAQFTIGKNAIMKNFPSPYVFNIGAHACVGLKEVFLLAAGHGVDFNWAIDGRNGRRNRDGLNGTPAMDNLIRDVHNSMEKSNIETSARVKTSIGYIIFWSDSFLRCFIKQKENSVWILTATFCPNENNKSSSHYTHVLAMGRSGQDHTPVIEHYMREAATLMSGFDCYMGKTNEIMRVALAMLVWNADRPELQYITGERKEGSYGLASHWACRVSEQLLPACIHCYIALIKKMTTKDPTSNLSCNVCCNWSFDPEVNNKELVANDSISKDYPTTYPTGDDIDPQPDGRTCDLKMLSPIKLNTQWMIQAVRSTYFGLKNGLWTKGQARDYLKTCNVKCSTVEFVIETAIRDKGEGVCDPSRVEPAFWKLVDCFGSFKFPALPMHGLCHGMIPNVMEIIHRIFKKYGKMATFCDYANPILSDLASFRLDYCKLKCLPKTAWVGENSMSFMRVMSYIYGRFLQNYPLGETEEATNTVGFIKCMLNSFQALVSILLSKRKSETNAIDDQMKLFLSSVHYLHKNHGKLAYKDATKGSPGKRKEKKKKKKKDQNEIFVNLQQKATLIGMLKALKLNHNGSIVQLRKNLQLATVKQITQKITVMNGNPSSRKKEDLFRCLRKIILPKAVDASTLTTVAVGASSAKPVILTEEVDVSPDTVVEEEAASARSEKMCWNKGNWMTFMANISKQIAYLGQLHLIW